MTEKIKWNSYSRRDPAWHVVEDSERYLFDVHIGERPKPTVSQVKITQEAMNTLAVQLLGSLDGLDYKPVPAWRRSLRYHLSSVRYYFRNLWNALLGRTDLD